MWAVNHQHFVFAIISTPKISPAVPKTRPETVTAPSFANDIPNTAPSSDTIPTAPISAIIAIINPTEAASGNCYRYQSIREKLPMTYFSVCITTKSHNKYSHTCHDFLLAV